MAEEWRDIPEWEGYYQASDRGRIKSLERVVEMRNGVMRPVKGRILAPAIDPEDGRLRVCLHRGGGGSMKLVHRLVAETFLGPPPEGQEVCHGDGDPSNCRLDNLRWDTHVANEADKRLHGTNDRSNRTHCPRGHLLASWNIPKYTADRGRRECLACRLTGAKLRAKDPTVAELFQVTSDRKYRILQEKHESRAA